MQDVLNTRSIQIFRGGEAAPIDQREAVRQCLDGSGHAVAADAAQFNKVLTRGKDDEKRRSSIRSSGMAAF